MTEASSSASADLTDTEKSAVIMMAIGQDAAAEIVKLLSAPEINRLSAAMTRISNISDNTAASVLQEFVDRMQPDRAIAAGAEEYLRGVLEKALGAEKADSLLGRLKEDGYAGGIEAVKWQDPRDLAEVVKAEHPQIVAMILAYLEPDQALTLMQLLPDELVEQVIPRLAVLDTLPPTALHELSESLENLFTREPRQSRVSIGGVASAAKILNRIGPPRADRVLSAISNVDPELAQALSDHMFVFEDLFEIDDRSLQILLRAVDQKLLISALKGTASALQDKVYQNLSQRAGQMLREEIEARGPMRLAEVEAAKKEILATAQALERESKIILRTSTADLVA